jgi:hypothetical protein
MSEDSRIGNPTGIGGLGERSKDRWRALFNRGEVVSCSATAKRTGKRCRSAPVQGYGVCQHHGGWGGRGRFRLPVNMRHFGNKDLKRAREMADAEVEQRFAAGELREAVQAIRPWVGKIHPADESRAVLAMAARLEGLGRPDGLAGEAWREARRAVGLIAPRAPAPTPPALAPEPPQLVELWGPRASKS